MTILNLLSLGLLLVSCLLPPPLDLKHTAPGILGCLLLVIAADILGAMVICFKKVFKK